MLKALLDFEMGLFFFKIEATSKTTLTFFTNSAISIPLLEVHQNHLCSACPPCPPFAHPYLKKYE